VAAVEVRQLGLRGALLGHVLEGLHPELFVELMATLVL
jgi:hypothetical protein